MIKVTPSSIGFLKECPRCLWLYFNQGVQRPRGIFPSLPSGMDEILKNYFDSFRIQNKLPPEIRGKVKGKLYPDLSKLKPMRQNFKGLVAEFPKLNIKLKGAIDELLVNDEGLYVVFDFKTRGYPLKADTHKHYQNQLDLYAILLEKNGLIPANYGYLFFIHPTKYEQGKATFKSEIVEMKIHWKNGLKILAEVKEILEGPLPKAHTDCEYCLYRSSTMSLFE
jgi:CRISPR/Cas system-associated exonuclease Cas4 (RecB family)